MKKAYLSLLAISLVFSLDSCKKLLNETAYSFLTPTNYPTNQSESVTALNGAYNVMQQPSGLYKYIASIYFSTADDQSHPNGAIAGTDHARWMTCQVTSAFAANKTFWIVYWQGINSCNGIIETVGKIKNQAWTPAVIAEAKALRAFYYFNLVRLYGDIPIKTDFTSQPVVNMPRSPVADVYELIISDLKTAETDLGNDTGNGGGRFTTGAVKALLAEVYMTFAGYRRTPDGQLIKGDASYYTLARDKAKEVLDRETSGMYVLSPDYSQIFKDLSSDVYNKEIIFDVEFLMSGNTANFPALVGAAGNGATLGGSNSGVNYNKEYVATYNVNDTRYAWDVANYKYSSGWVRTPLTDPNTFGMAKYQKIPFTTYTFDYPTNFPLIRLADIKLLYAEAINEINGGPTTEAYQQINQIRYRARPTAHKSDGTVLPDLAGLTQAQFKDAIIQERSWELTLEGVRRFDLIRWGIYVEKVKTQTSQTISTLIQPKNYLLPIPKDELDLNTTWKQNDGY